MNESVNKAIKTRLGEAKEILIASHVRPDGDAVGALLGLGLALQQSGKKVQMVLGGWRAVLFQIFGRRGTNKNFHKRKVRYIHHRGLRRFQTHGQAI